MPTLKMIQVMKHGKSGLMIMKSTADIPTKLDSLILEGIIFYKIQKNMIIRLFCIVCMLASSVSCSYAQSTHVIEPAIMEVRYNVVQGKNKDAFAFRCGKTVSQYFSVNTYRDDSLRSSPDPAVSTIVLDEMLEEAYNRNDPSKRRPSSPDYGTYFYWNMTAGKISVYSRAMLNRYVSEEDIPTMEWEIEEDSVMTVIGYECHKAKTHFRGRDWTVFYTEAIPVSHGPWKFNGLPGMILLAKCDGYITITACEISTTNLTPVTFYNFLDYKFQPMERKKVLDIKTNPKTYPANTIIRSPMELE